MRNFWTALIIMFVMLLAACGDHAGRKQAAGKPLLLWHAWDEQETAALEELLEKFAAAYPDIRVVCRRLRAADFPARFVAQARLGLGADMVIMPGRSLPDLAAAGVIQDLEPHRLDTSIYFSTALQTLRYHGRLYGVPLSLHTQALYFNRTLTGEPPAALQDLLDVAASGKPVALNTGFYGAFWGIQAFGGDLFDQDGRVILNQGGMANWLNWLKKAQNAPNVILTNDPNTLLTLFTQQRVAYAVGGSERLRELQKALGETAVGVAPLPAGPNQPSGPILETDALFFNAAAPPEQTERALRLAQFLTNYEQQTELLRQLQRVPANARVWVDHRIYPAAAGFAAQARTAVARPNLPQFADVERAGSDAYIQTLSGVMDGQKAAAQLTASVNAKYGLETQEVAPPAACALAGTLRVWHLPQEIETFVLQEITANFTRRCPGIRLEFRALTFDENEADSDSRAQEQFQAAAREGSAPDALIGSNHLTALLASGGLLQDLNAAVDADFLQRYIPEAVEAMRYDGSLYALPISVTELMALYYNRDLVTDAPLALDDLLYQADAGRKIALPLSNFYYAYWGLPAFGAQLFDQDYRVTLERGGFAEWLTWLKNAQEHPNIALLLAEDVEEAKTPFARGEAAYFAGEVRQLSELQAALGKERVGVAPLPAGPQGRAKPILGVEGVMLSRASTAAQTQLAVEFAKYLAEVESQTALMERANQVPANVNVDTSSHPAIAGFLEQARSASVPPIVPQIGAVFAWGGAPYQQVLQQGIAPNAAAKVFADLVNKANGFAVDSFTPPDACARAGKVIFWHSWPEAQATALRDLIAQFAQVCPNIQVEAAFAPADKLRERLVAADDASRPDVALLSDAQFEEFRQSGMLQDLRPLLDPTAALRYRFPALAAFEDGEALYGLPFGCRLMTLFYNPRLANPPAAALDDLLAAASPAAPLAIDVSYYGAFWGVSAFGGNVSGANNALKLGRKGFVEWLRWLQTARQRPGVILQADATALRRLFAEGKAAYLFAESDALASFRRALGDDGVGVAALPVGSAGAVGRAFLRVDGLAVIAGKDESQMKAAAAFAEFAASDAGQTILMNAGQIAPTNQLTAAAIADPTLAVLSERVESSLVLPDMATMAALNAAGNAAIESVLTGGATPEAAVETFLQTMRGNQSK